MDMMGVRAERPDGSGAGSDDRRGRQWRTARGRLSSYAGQAGVLVVALALVVASASVGVTAVPGAGPPAVDGAASPTAAVDRIPAAASASGNATTNGSGDLAYSSLDAPAETAVGETVPVRATVANTGDGTVDYRVPLVVDGDVVATATGTLSPGERTTLAFAWRPTEAGSHAVSVGTVSTTVVARWGEPVTATGRVYDASTLADGIGAFRDRTAGSLPAETYVLLADGDAFVVFAEQAPSPLRVVDVTGQAPDATLEAGNRSYDVLVVPDGDGEAGVRAQVDEGSPPPTITDVPGGTAVPGERFTLSARAENVDVALIGLPAEWAVVDYGPELRNCVGPVLNPLKYVNNGACELRFVVPVTDSDTAGALADAIIGEIRDLLPPLVEGLVGPVLDTIRDPLADLLSTVVSELLDRLGVREVQVALWLSTPGPADDRVDTAALDVEAAVPADERRRSTRVAVLAGDLLPASVSPSDVRVVTVPIAGSNQPPTADAGANRTVEAGSVVELDGTASSDPDGDALAYSWTSDAPAGSLTDADTATPTFTAPGVGTETTYRVELTVDDGNGGTDTDTVAVTVRPAALTMHVGTGGTLVARPNSRIEVPILVDSAPDGIARVNAVDVSVGNASVATVASPPLNNSSGGFPAERIDLNGLSPTRVNFSASALSNASAPGPGTDVLVGTVVLATGDATGTTTIDLEARPGFGQSSLSGSRAARENASIEFRTVDASLTVSTNPFPGRDPPPRDALPSQPGLEDFDGDGRFTFLDVVEVLSVLGDVPAGDAAKVDAVDYDDDGTFTFLDVVELLFRL